jgi:hypothetical protein
MGEIVNLRQAKKRRARAEKAEAAEQNRVRFGLTAEEKLRLRLETSRRAALLDGKKREE